MYAWEKPFSKSIKGTFIFHNLHFGILKNTFVILVDIREKEKGFLEATAYVQSASVALTPVVPVIAVIVTFLAHIGFGYDLTPVEVCPFFLLLRHSIGLSRIIFTHVGIRGSCCHDF